MASKSEKTESKKSGASAPAKKTAAKGGSSKAAKKPAEEGGTKKSLAAGAGNKKTSVAKTKAPKAEGKKKAVSEAKKAPGEKAAPKKAQAKKAVSEAKKAPGEKASPQRVQPKKAQPQNDEAFYGESSSLSAPLPEKKEGANGKKILAVAAAGLLLLLLVFFGAKGIASAVSGGGRGGSGESQASQRTNTLALARKYLDKGQYDKAMDLLNGLLILNPNDADADSLLDQAIRLKSESDALAASSNPAFQQGDSSYNINIDTDELTAALREQNERSRQMINELLEQQRQSQKAMREEAAAEKKAAEELKKKEEADRKAKEEALAQKSAALKTKISSINEKVMAGKADLNTGNIDSALNNFNSAVSQLPLPEGEPAFSASKYSEVASALYDAAEAEKDPAKKERLKREAVTYVNKSLSVNPNDPVSHYIMGMNYGEASPPNWERAAKELEAAVQNDSDNYMYYYQLGRAQFRLKNYSAARSSFESAAKRNKDFDLAHYNLGMTLKRLKLNSDAMKAFRNAYAANPQNSKAYLEEARILNDVYKDSQGAISRYQKVIELDPVNQSALNECGVVYSNLKQYAKAEECHRKAVALFKPGEKQPITYYNLATALYNQQKNSEAEKYARLAYEQKDVLKSAKEKAAVTYNYALIEESLGASDKAIALYKEVLSFDPDNAKTKTNLGVMFMSMNPPDADSALAFFLDAYKLDKSFELENNLGSAYLSKKDYANAITHFQNGLRQKPKDGAIRFNLAQAHSGAGDFESAKAVYLDLIGSDPQNYDSYIELAKVFIALKDTASAESYLKILRQKNPTYKKAEVDRLLAATAVSAN